MVLFHFGNSFFLDGRLLPLDSYGWRRVSLLRSSSAFPPSSVVSSSSFAAEQQVEKYVEAISCCDQNLAVLAKGQVWIKDSRSITPSNVKECIEIPVRPLVVGLSVRISTLACGAYHALMASQEAGVSWGYGRNAEGQIGTGDFRDRDSPSEIFRVGEEGRGVEIRVVAGHFHSFFLLRNGLAQAHSVLLSATGSRRAEETGTRTVSEEERKTRGDGEVGREEPRRSHIQRSNMLACGANRYGQTGTGVGPSYTHEGDSQGTQGRETILPESVCRLACVPVPMNVPLPRRSSSSADRGKVLAKEREEEEGDFQTEGEVWVQVSGGATHSCGLTSDGRVASWGSNLHGQLFMGEGAESSRVQTVTSPEEVRVQWYGDLEDEEEDEGFGERVSGSGGKEGTSSCSAVACGVWNSVFLSSDGRVAVSGCGPSLASPETSFVHSGKKENETAPLAVQCQRKGFLIFRQGVAAEEAEGERLSAETAAFLPPGVRSVACGSSVCACVAAVRGRVRTAREGDDGSTQIVRRDVQKAFIWGLGLSSEAFARKCGCEIRETKFDLTAYGGANVEVVGEITLFLSHPQSTLPVLPWDVLITRGSNIELLLGLDFLSNKKDVTFNLKNNRMIYSHFPVFPLSSIISLQQQPVSIMQCSSIPPRQAEVEIVCSVDGKEIVHEVHTTGPPIRWYHDRVAYSQREMLREELKQMEEAGLIKPSSSIWATLVTVVLVPKPDETIHFCFDFRKLNAATQKDGFPMPRIDEVVHLVEGASVFTVLDVSSGFWQIGMREQNKEKTTFVTPFGLYQFKVMAQGLINAPATFQQAMQLVLLGLPRELALVYIDDLIIFLKDFDSYLKDLRTLLDRV
uniref:Reverse transcriptase domain-containing protein n=1 Tax=Chromera velia CCMP2878 TaxID=1169474 RepID=A0A0G4FKD4_9ALVE|eukprot:Cvel_3454.t1-p1 / transcript=Cvel_3454.t1 / gene=Cvel_3454 / organism=Chromera_velia_CCMP2878 / gene_product=Transposon Ty3-I Gag-Pol polyprotein, putative / transcript_product=Transposon Ty3-I Gag-Pol polyprotein, putative / location=Cvel_scaffold139:45874-54221(+) / protein_length=855 / sequence_SO=supercontig / SO=protein_coding / is_pseudo=false